MHIKRVNAAIPSKLQKLVQDVSDGVHITEVDLSNCGLSEIPEILYQLRSSITLLNLGQNCISDLPPWVEELDKLRILFFANNAFSTIPSVLGKMKSLYMLSFKSNKLEYIPADALSPSVGWLILTDNRLKELPNSIGNLTLLRKLMLAGNQLSALPAEMKNCRELELVRLAANTLDHLPDWLLQLPKLSWLAFAGNLFSLPDIKHHANTSDSGPCSIQGIHRISWNSLELQEKLGEGASGVIWKALWKQQTVAGGELSGGVMSSVVRSDREDTRIEGQGNFVVQAAVKEVAVKLFKSGKTSDGLPEDEMRASASGGEHACSLRVLGLIVGAPNDQLGLVLPLIPPEFKILGGPPSFGSVTRDTYPNSTRFELSFILRVLCGIASVCSHLHARGISHGDLYAHNILADAQGNPLLSDFGAASFYDHSSREAGAVEGFEVRAFGCLIEDLVDHSVMFHTSQECNFDVEDKSCPRSSGPSNCPVSMSLRVLQDECMNPDSSERPRFSAIYDRLIKLDIDRH